MTTAKDRDEILKQLNKAIDAVSGRTPQTDVEFQRHVYQVLRWLVENTPQ